MPQPDVNDGPDERLFKAQLGLLPETAAFIDAFCRRHGVGLPVALRITLVVEELFTNTVEHGYHGDSEALIRVALGIDGDAVALLYEDRAPAHDPLSLFPETAVDPDATLGSRPVGGLGMVLVTQLARAARYAREDDCNRLWLKLSHARQPR
ncbi:MAG: ATP-binding protein [Casimicrobiaceae bacterium]